ncbi:uncharacterized protein KIAA1841 homolog [Aplysia californica]|uniref:Uncharacterized protein KIAA1841 homolog n=1 Tax=Aplysia californica TaxID=6500 RepID=A0ABM1W448_APLCA|nr:uncharacterized protein KIAA1841 homolog [Aplysia californica]
MSSNSVEPSSRIGVTLDLILKTLIASSDFTSLQTKNWEAISRLIPGTTAIQCARRYEELLTGGGGVAIQHLSRSVSTHGLSLSSSSASLSELEGQGRPGYNNNRPGSSKAKGGREDKDKVTSGKDAVYKRDLGQKGPTMVIHVCDEAKNLKKDFHCPRDLLVQEMKYFAEYLSTDAQRWEEVDISVHCDVQIFDWLIKYVKRGSKEITEEPKLEANNVVSILISSDFLKMDTLVSECIKFCHQNMSTIVATPCNMGCINDRLLTRISDLFTHNEADAVKDRKDKFKSKLFSKKIERLFEPEGANPDSPERATSLFRCSVCKRILTHVLQTQVKCMPSRMTIDHNGKLTYSHVRDPSFDVNEYILELKSQLKTWRDVYWRLWGTINSLTCTRCGEAFPLVEFGHCSYHPEPARYDNESAGVTSCVGNYPCCNHRALRFDPTLITKGCRVKDHIVGVSEGGDGEGSSRPVKSATQRVYEDLLARRDVICVPFQRLSDLSDMEPDVFTNEIFACHYHSTGLHLPSLSAAGVEEGKPRLQALTMHKEVSYFMDDNEFGDSDDEIGDEESNKESNSSSSMKRVSKGLKRSRVTVEPQAILVDAPGFEQSKKSTWDTQRSMRYNQDAQRQEDARRMKEIRLFLSRLRLGADKVDKPKREYAGGIFSKLESQWRAANLQPQGKQSQVAPLRNRLKPFGQVRSSLT